MIGAIALVTVLAHGPCVPDPTLTPRPTQVHCTVGRVDQIHGDWRCDRILDAPDGTPRQSFDWMWVARPKPSSNGLGPQDVCLHRDGYTWRCHASGPSTYSFPCDWYLSEVTDR